MKMSSVAPVFVAVVVAAVVLSEALTRGQPAEAPQPVPCNPMELSSCADPISSGEPPSDICCEKLREQKPCLCEFIQNPFLRDYVSNPNAQKVASTCGIAWPQC